MHKKISILLSIVITVAVILLMYVYFSLSGVQQSHLEVLERTDDLKQAIQKSLDQHVSSLYGQGVQVRFSFLLDSPMQAGLGDPKYFLWVEFMVLDEKKEGLVKGALVAENEFSVTDITLKEQLVNGSGDWKRFTPSIVIDEIHSRLKIQ